jgi:hypothetical protein
MEGICQACGRTTATTTLEPVSGRVKTVDGYAGEFELAIAVEGHSAGAPVRVTVSALHPSLLVLDFSDDHQVLRDACVLLCGHVGTLTLLELGYTGPLVRRPLMADRRTYNRPRATSGH